MKKVFLIGLTSIAIKFISCFNLFTNREGTMKLRLSMMSVMLILIAFVNGIQAQSVWDGSVSATFSGGTGTAEDPFQIADGAQLAKLAQDVNNGNSYANTFFVLIEDIVLNNTEGWENWNETNAPNNKWIPIGDDNVYFAGILDGNEHTVSGIYICSPDAQDQALFGFLDEGGVIKNIGVTNSFIKGLVRVAGLCAQNKGTLENCYNAGNISATGENTAGGICGYSFDGSYIINCYNTGSISGQKCIGGICGSTAISSSITNCYNKGIINGTQEIGGICGYNWGVINSCYNTADVNGTSIGIGGICGWNNGGTLNNTYNSGKISGQDKVGGLSGHNSSSTTTCITNSYNIGNISSWGYECGSICGSNGSLISNCYWLVGTSYNAVGYSGGNANVTNTESKNNVDFASGIVTYYLQNSQENQVWGQNISRDPKDNYPILGGDKVYLYGDGTYGNTPLPVDIDGFYIISTADELRTFASLVNAGQNTINGKLTANILLNDTTDWKNWNETNVPVNVWKPIGNPGSPFLGTLDGQGYAVCGVYATGYSYVGFVGYLGNYGCVRNLGVKASYVKGENNVAGVCATNSFGYITNCYNAGNVVGNTFVGGVCGYSYEYVSTYYCYNTGNVTGSGSNIGGVNGYNRGPLYYCYNTGTVTGGRVVGGVCGYNAWNGEGNVYCCFNVGNVTGDSSVGSVCGDNKWKISNCFYLEGTANDGIGQNNDQGVVTMMTKDQFTKGEVAYLLNRINSFWGQTIGVESYPVLNGKKVYLHGNHYSNLQNQDENGFYLISNGDELRYFSGLVNSGQTDVSAKLTADIELNDNVDQYMEWPDVAPKNVWKPIGKNFENSFMGTFDGQGHSISGIYIKSAFSGDYYPGYMEEYYGFFGCIAEDGVVKNVGLEKSCYMSSSDMMNMEMGGIAARNDGSIINCYNTSYFKECYLGGGIAKYSPGIIENCYFAGVADRYFYPITRDYGSNINNCYYMDNLSEANGAGTRMTAEQFANGEVAGRLQGDQEELVWGQTVGLDELPVFTSDESKKIYVFDIYNGSATPVNGYANMGANISLPEGTNSIALIEEQGTFFGDNVILKQSDGTYTCENLVLVDGADFYTPVNFTATNASYSRQPKGYLQTIGGNCGWESICLPFSGTLYVGDGDAVQALQPATNFSEGQYWLRRYTNFLVPNTVCFTDEELAEGDMIQAGVPYLISLPGSGFGVESLEGQTISVRGSNVTVSMNTVQPTYGCMEFSGTFAERTADTFCYMLDSDMEEGDGSLFLTALNETNAPFRCRMDITGLNVGSRSSQVKSLANMPAYLKIGNGSTTDIEETSSLSARVKVISVGGRVAVETSIPTDVCIYNCEGRILWNGNVCGMQITNLQSGQVYIVNGMKVMP